MLDIRLKDEVPNVVIRERTKITDILQRILSTKQKWLGHIVRLGDNRLIKVFLQWFHWEDKKNGGRPLTFWTKDLKRTEMNWLEAAQDRSNWKQLAEAYIQSGHSTGFVVLHPIQQIIYSISERCPSKKNEKPSR